MDKDTQKKIFITKVAIVVFVIVVAAAWSANLKNVWLTEGRLSSNKNGNQDWLALKGDLERTLVNVQDSLASIKEAANKQDIADKNAFLGEVLDGAKQIASSTDSATSSPILSATSSPVASSSPVNNGAEAPVQKNNQCPEYINCMPTIGEARPCQIPVGCEGITTIAY